MRHSAEAPVGNERPAVVVEEHVARLQVAVYDAKTMQVHKALATQASINCYFPPPFPSPHTRRRTRNMPCSTRHASATLRWGARLSSHAFMSPPLHHGIWMYLSPPEAVPSSHRRDGCVRS